MTSLTRVFTIVVLACASLAAQTPVSPAAPAAPRMTADVLKTLPAADQKILNEALVPAAPRDPQVIERILKGLSVDDQAIVKTALDGVETRQQFIDRISMKLSAQDVSSLGDALRPVGT